MDGLPINSMVIFHGELLNNQMVYWELWTLGIPATPYVNITGPL